MAAAGAKSPAVAEPALRLDAAWLKLAVAFVLALGVVYWLPRAAGTDGIEPPLSTLVAAGALIGVLTTSALFLALRFDLSLPWTVGLYAVAYNGLIVFVKFVFGPAGLYEVNHDVNLSSDLGDPTEAAFAAGAVLVLYAAVYYAIYRFTRRRIEEQALGFPRRQLAGAWIVLPLMIVGYLFATTGALVVLAIPLFFAAGGIEYVQFVFSSSFSLAVALSLAGATALAALAFREVGMRASLVGDVGILVSFFWVGLAFLVLYQALWVVYVLVLTSLWPLRVVVPK